VWTIALCFMVRLRRKSQMHARAPWFATHITPVPQNVDAGNSVAFSTLVQSTTTAARTVHRLLKKNGFVVVSEAMDHADIKHALGLARDFLDAAVRRSRRCQRKRTGRGHVLLKVLYILQIKECNEHVHSNVWSFA
jgi:hypothetical protein